MGRETNTIGNKSASSSISGRVVDLVSWRRSVSGWPTLNKRGLLLVMTGPSGVGEALGAGSAADSRSTVQCVMHYSSSEGQ